MITLALFLFGCYVWPSMPIWYIVLGLVVGVVEFAAMSILTAE